MEMSATDRLIENITPKMAELMAVHVTKTYAFEDIPDPNLVPVDKLTEWFRQKFDWKAFLKDLTDEEVKEFASLLPEEIDPSAPRKVLTKAIVKLFNDAKKEDLNGKPSTV